MTGMLASVSNLDEAIMVQAAGADIIDLKAPAKGALGALQTDTVEEIVKQLKPATVISATIGDLPMQPEIVQHAVDKMWATGVDYVKIGLFPGGDWISSIAVLKARTSAGARLIAVFFADCDPDTKWFSNLASSGFSGVMLDTRNKRAGSLRQILNRDQLAHFVKRARQYNLLCGLAGSLRSEDIDPLLDLSPDYLGFRGALCIDRNRLGCLDPEAIRSIRDKIGRSEEFLLCPE
ncbi:MAG: (5-formylfuran-3-yl)methyl phosphate synthase [Methylococcales bacterium]